MDSPKLEQAHQLRQCGDYEAAIVLYQDILDRQDDCAPAWWGLAHCTFNHVGDFAAAQSQFERAVSLAPQNLRYLLDLAKYFAMLSMDEDAKSCFERIIAMDATTTEAGEAKKQLAYYR